MAAYVSYITAVDELNAPPEQQVLEIAVVGDDVTLGIVRIKENWTKSTFTKVHEDAGIIVSRQDLLDILLADLPEAAGHVKVRVNGDKDVVRETAALLGRLLREKLSQS